MSNRFSRWLHRGLAASTLGALALSALPAQAAPWARNRNQFASPRFQQVWSASDKAVAEGRSNRSWTWGPGPWFDYKEFYKQSPNGLRQVQYFDKARMEINAPSNTSGPLGGVTNGLLPVEMISGRIKLGDGIGDDQNDNVGYAADIPVAGDAENNYGAPTYASFRNIATVDNGYRDQNKVGQRVDQTLRVDGSLGVVRPDLAQKPGAEITVYETATGHNVPKVFDDFRNSLPGVRAIDAFGLPITDAYWVTTKVAGKDSDVLVQIFERRVITYTPSNPAAFQVEMGNVGQHYFQWRYGLGTPWSTPDPVLPITFASRQGDGPNGSGTAFEVRQIFPDGSNEREIGFLYGDQIPYSVARVWSDDMPCTYVAGAVNGPGDKQQIGMISDCLRTSYGAIYFDGTSNYYDPALSPDGQKVAFVSDRDGNPELYLINFDYNTTATFARLTDTIDCVNGRPSWLPDGSGLVYESNCQGGNYEIYRGTLNYVQDKQKEIQVGLISPANATRLTFNNSDDRWPRVSPDGSLIAFFSTRDGNSEIYTMTGDGGQQARITDNPAADQAPTWSPDGTALAFNSNRDGDFEIFVYGREAGDLRQITRNTVDDGYAVWAQ